MIFIYLNYITVDYDDANQLELINWVCRNCFYYQVIKQPVKSKVYYRYGAEESFSVKPLVFIFDVG